MQEDWSVQVKTNRKTASFWLVGEKARAQISPSHLYVLVNPRPADGKHEYFVLRSREVADKTRVSKRAGSIWHTVNRRDIEPARDRWRVVWVG